MAFQPGMSNDSQHPYSVFSIWSPQKVPEAVVIDGIIQNSFSSLDIISRYGVRTYDGDGKCVSIGGLSIGDRKQITIQQGQIGTNSLHYITIPTGGFSCYAEIIGFDHNAEKEGYGITFMFCFNDGGTDKFIGFGASAGSAYTTGGFLHNSTDTNSGGWKGCQMRYSVLGSTNSNGQDPTNTCTTDPVENSFMSRLPEDMRKVLKPMTKYSDNTGGFLQSPYYNKDRITPTKDYLPILSVGECFGKDYLNSATKYTNQAELEFCQPYDSIISQDGKSKLYYKWNSLSTALRLRLRSVSVNAASTSSTKGFGIITQSGTISYTSSIGGSWQEVPTCIAPIFLI